MYQKIIAPVLLFVISTIGACSQPQQTIRPSQSAPASDEQPPTAVPGDSAGRKRPYLPPWNFMSLSTAGVDTWLQDHPTYDGRGVVILVFDTGVDMSIAGLQQTSTGLPKVIDAIDFSRSNVVKFRPAKIEGSGASQAITAPGQPVRLRNAASLSPQPVDGTWYAGYIDESIYRNSGVRDFDGDGVSTAKFGALLYRAADGWRVVVDTDNDSSMANEKPVGSYRERLESFQFRQNQSEGPTGKSPLTFAASIDTVTKQVGFHYDMNVHGTHVAGIAAGFGINREPGFNGIAPGAQVVSGKFSADTAKDITITGSMRRAYEYAGRLADSLEKLHTPVVINMSFGIGSAIEGRADIESFIDHTIAAHPNLYVVTSAGNEGPGLSSVGIPAGASRVISVGAMLPKGIGNDSYSASLANDVLWDFSSRGGELDKPDIVAPGTAVSTITRFSYESRLSGTSMASPYTTGVVALLVSALRQVDSSWVPTQALIRRALRVSAQPLADYAAIEQGGGVLNVQRAFDLLLRYRQSGFARDIQEYSISTYSPNFPDERGPTAFWRSSYIPDEEWKQSFMINRQSGSRQGDEFFRAFTLQSTAPWLRTVQKTVYIRNDNPAQVDVVYDRSKLSEPGLYSAKVVARRASSAGEAAEDEVEFELVNSVIVPYLFSADKGYSVTTPPQKLTPGGTRRFYFAPPSGASALTFTLNVPKGSRSNVAGSIIDQNGYTVNYLPRVKGHERSEGSNTVTKNVLGNGIIEVVAEADAMEGTGEPSEFTLTVTCEMLDFDVDVEGTGRIRDLHVSAVNTGPEIVEGNTSYTIKGYGRTVRDTMRGDTWSMPVTMRKQDGALWIYPRFAPEDYIKSTDIIARLVDASGNVQAEETYNKPHEALFLPNFDREKDSTVYRLEILFGFAASENLPKIPIEIVENHVRPSEPRPVDGYSGTTLVPYIPQRFGLRLPPQDIPSGYHGLGELVFKPRGKDLSIVWDFSF